MLNCRRHTSETVGIGTDECMLELYHLGTLDYRVLPHKSMFVIGISIYITKHKSN